MGMSEGTYRTVAAPGRAAFEIRGSEFVGYVSPAETVAAAEAFVAEIESRHPDATHHVPAYRVPADTSTSTSTSAADVLLREWCSDDGEPSGSSGKPALNVLVQRDLRDVVACVARYYGGTDLGVGGLARAYARAVTAAVDDAGVVEERPHERFAAVVDYDDSGTVRGILESADAEFEADYDAAVSFSVRVPVEEAPGLRDRLRSATSGRVDLS
jgi:uncharacterized YigZ family protein